MNVTVKLKRPVLLAAGIRTLSRIRGTTLGQEVKRNAGIITEYCAKMLPPTTGKGQNKNAIKQSWNTQKRAGEKAIKRDVAKVFQPLRSLAFLKNVQWAAAVQKMIRRRDIAGLEKFLKEKGVRNQVIEEATVEIHNQHRNKRGRAKKSGGPYLVLKAPSIKKVEKHQIGHVGKAKAGYVPALRTLGREIPPEWVTRHSTPGFVQDRTWNPLKPSIRVSNDVGYGYSFAHMNIPGTAIEIRGKTAGREIRESLKGKLKAGMKSTGLGK